MWPNYHRILMLKIIIILSLVNLNGGVVEVDGRLVEMDGELGGLSKIISGLIKRMADMLPKSFCHLLRGKRSMLNPEVMARALSSVDDSLVIVCSRIINIPVPCAIIVDTSKSEKEIMDVLFSENTWVPHESGTAHDEETSLPVKEGDGSKKGKKKKK